MLSNAYFLAKFRFDTAENEPAKNLQILLIFSILLTLARRRRPAELLHRLGEHRAVQAHGLQADAGAARVEILQVLLLLFWAHA